MKVTVYGRPDRVCYKCRATKAWLDRRGIPYVFVDVDTDPASADMIRDLGALEVPVVMVLDGTKEDDGSTWWAGHREPLLEQLKETLDSLK